MVNRERQMIISAATSAIEESCRSIISNLGILSLVGGVDCDSVNEEGEITFQFRDLSRLKEFRRRLGLPPESAEHEGHQQTLEHQKSSCSEHQGQWECKIGMPHLGSLYKFCISLEDGVIEAPIGHESDTSPAQSQL